MDAAAAPPSLDATGATPVGGRVAPAERPTWRGRVTSGTTGGLPTLPDEFRRFYRVSSPFYPALERWFDQAAAAWVAEQQRED